MIIVIDAVGCGECYAVSETECGAPQYRLRHAWKLLEPGSGCIDACRAMNNVKEKWPPSSWQKTASIYRYSRY